MVGSEIFWKGMGFNASGAHRVQVFDPETYANAIFPPDAEAAPQPEP